MLKNSLLFAVFLVGGCVGELEPSDPGTFDDGPPVQDPDPPAGLARQMYEDNVHPIMTAKCGAGCHLTTSASSTPFVAAADTQAYITMVSTAALTRPSRALPAIPWARYVGICPR